MPGATPLKPAEKPVVAEKQVADGKSSLPISTNTVVEQEKPLDLIRSTVEKYIVAG
jgi:hypothetical protein